MLDRMEAGELSSAEIVDALLARMERVDREVNAVVCRLEEGARRDARRADEARARGEARGPLHGLPITVKEHVGVAGTPSTEGIRALQNRVSEEDAAVVAAARSAGAVVLAKTNVPQTLASPIHTVNHLWGRTSNPWSTAHASGGSSGGEGAALAAGMSVLGIGSDIGGSIRLPAFCCGVCGLKPTWSRWSNRGSRSLMNGMAFVSSQLGPMARRVGDLGLFLDAVAGAQRAFDDTVPPDAGDAAAGGVFGEPAGEMSGAGGVRSVSGTGGLRDVSGLRVGVYEDDGFLTPAASVRRAVRKAADVLEEAGAEVMDYRPVAPREVPYLMFAAATADGVTTFREALQGEEPIGPLRDPMRIGRLPKTLRRALAALMRWRGEPRLARLVEVTGRKPVEELWRLTARRKELRRLELERWRQAGIDAVLCPPFPTPAAPHGVGDDFTVGFSYAVRFNLFDLPAGVVPVTRVRPEEAGEDALEAPAQSGMETAAQSALETPAKSATESAERSADRLDRRVAEIAAASEGLPVGVQVAARPWREDVALRLMAAVEAAASTGDEFPMTPVDP